MKTRNEKISSEANPTYVWLLRDLRKHLWKQLIQVQIIQPKQAAPSPNRAAKTDEIGRPVTSPMGSSHRMPIPSAGLKCHYH